MPSPAEILQMLNSVGVGRLDRMLERLDRAHRGLEEQGLGELAEKLKEGRDALAAGQEGQYQKRLAHVVSKLGHLKS